MPLTIRAEAPADADEIGRLVGAAFGDTDTPAFVRAVRAGTDVCLAQLVTDGDRILAHAQYVQVPLAISGQSRPSAYLACLAVAPDRQGQGIGSLLVRDGLARLRREGFAVATVLGDPAYYPRFGFSSALGRRIQAPHRKRGDAFMAVELVDGALGVGAAVADFPTVLVPEDAP
jgi:putative acetyltransferase